MKTMVITLSAVLIVTSFAAAQPPGGRGGPGGGPPSGGPQGNGPGEAVLQALDADGNHEVSAEEIANAPAALKTLDVNGDGKLSDADVSHARGNRENRNNRGQNNRNRAGRSPSSEREGRGQGGPEHRNGPRSPEDFVSHAMKFDADGDGKLSETELNTFAEQMGPPPGEGGGRRGNKGSGKRPERPARPE